MSNPVNACEGFVEEVERLKSAIEIFNWPGDSNLLHNSGLRSVIEATIYLSSAAEALERAKTRFSQIEQRS